MPDRVDFEHKGYLWMAFPESALIGKPPIGALTRDRYAGERWAIVPSDPSKMMIDHAHLAENEMARSLSKLARKACDHAITLIIDYA